MFITVIYTPINKWGKEASGASSDGGRGYVLDAKNRDGAIALIKNILSHQTRDPEIQELLCRGNGHKPGEYFTVYLREVKPSEGKVVEIIGNVSLMCTTPEAEHFYM